VSLASLPRARGGGGAPTSRRSGAQSGASVATRVATTFAKPSVRNAFVVSKSVSKSKPRTGYSVVEGQYSTATGRAAWTEVQDSSGLVAEVCLQAEPPGNDLHGGFVANTGMVGRLHISLQEAVQVAPLPLAGSEEQPHAPLALAVAVPEEQPPPPAHEARSDPEGYVGVEEDKAKVDRGRQPPPRGPPPPYRNVGSPPLPFRM